MRKPRMVFALALTCSLVLALAAGCQGNEKKAREYIERAREKGKAVALQQKKLQDQGGELLKFLNNIKSINPETVAVMKKLFVGLVAQVESTSKAAQEARTEYENVLELDGVEAYKEYASNRIKVLELIDRRSSLLRQVGTVYEAVLDRAVAGQPIDEAAVAGALEPVFEERDRLAAEIEKLNDEAAGIAGELDI